ncbi:MAG: hypothetical protein C0608_05005 [Deltaproteobacteria bacterium]|nr:MAG: hypothetical protein C0608_05005 [Deltaproteobacteria bacterium]
MEAAPRARGRSFRVGLIGEVNLNHVGNGHIKESGNFMMKRLLSVLLVLMLPLFSYAASDKDQVVTELMKAMKMDKIAEQVIPQVKQFVGQMSSQMKLPEEARPDFEKFQEKVIERSFEVMDLNGSNGELKAIFSDVYTFEELEGILDFYKSPVGQSMIDKQPLLMQKIMQYNQEKMQLLLPEIQRMGAEFSAKMKEKFGK